MHSISALEHLKILTNLQEYKVSHMMHESNHMVPYYHVWCLGCQLLTGSNDGYFHLQIMWIDEALIANTQNKIFKKKKYIYLLGSLERKLLCSYLIHGLYTFFCTYLFLYTKNINSGLSLS